MKTFHLAIVLSAAALVAAAPFQPASAQRQSLADRVASLEQQAAGNQVSVDLLNQVTQLRSEIQALRSQNEELQHKLDQLEQSGKAQYLDIDGRLTRLEGGGFDPIDKLRADVPGNLPEELSAAWFGGRLTCRDYSDDGFSTLRPEFRSVPDLDGDGRRDWIEIPPACAETNAGVDQFSLWVTAGNETLEKVYDSEFERYPSIDIGTTPATVLENPACGYGEACPDMRLRWDGGGRRFVRTGR